MNPSPKYFQNWHIIHTTSSVDTVKWYETYWMQDARKGARGGVFQAIAVGRSALNRLQPRRSREGHKQVELSFPVKEERRDAFRGISRGLIGPRWVTLQYHK